MCEKCEEREHQEKALKSCSLCATGIKPVSQEIVNVNREVEDPVAEAKRIDEEMRQQHKEAIKGYDNQLGECLLDVAKWSTKMLIMYDDYLKKGDTKGCVKILQSINNYLLLSRTAISTAYTTSEMLINKVRGSG